MSYLMGDDAHAVEHQLLSQVSLPQSVLPGAGASINDRRFVGGIEYYWNGTRWLSTELLSLPLGVQDGAMPLAAGSHNFDVVVPRHYVNGWYLEDIKWEFFSATAQSATIFYTLKTLVIANGGVGTVTFLTAVSGTADTKLATTASQHYSPADAIVYNSVRSAADYLIFFQAAIGGGAPGTYILNATANVRLIG